MTAARSITRYDGEEDHGPAMGSSFHPPSTPRLYNGNRCGARKADRVPETWDAARGKSEQQMMKRHRRAGTVMVGTGDVAMGPCRPTTDDRSASPDP